MINFKNSGCVLTPIPCDLVSVAHLVAWLRRKITGVSVLAGDPSPRHKLEILCVDDWLSSTCTDIQAGACLSLRFNKTHHIVPH